MSSDPLTPDQLYRYCDPQSLGFESTDDLEDLAEVLGQERAVEAVKFGIGIRSDGYNLFALGPNALGKYSIIRRFLESQAAEQPVPDDWCYVHNFAEAHKPKALRLPPGTALALRSDMERLIEETQSGIQSAFESDDYHHRRAAIDEEFREKQGGSVEDLQERARAKNIALMRTPMGLALAPVIDGEVMSPEVFGKLPKEQREETERDIETLQGELREIMQQAPQLDRQRRARIRELEKEVTMFAIGHLIESTREKYAEHDAVIAYLGNVQDDLIEHANDLRPSDPVTPPPPPPFMPGSHLGRSDDSAAKRRYKVNVLVSSAETSGVPVVYEDNPTYANLVGRIEHIPEMGALITDFTLIKSGALHRANGGYLMLDARKLLTQPFAWEALKRALKSREIRLESANQAMNVISTISLDPQPIPLDTKVVLIGDRQLYYMLCSVEPEFGDLFKVEVDFEEDMDRNEDSSRLYARLIAGVIHRNGLRSFTAPAVARVVEQASRIASDSEKVSIHFGNITDLLREADFWAADSGNNIVDRDDVQRAIDAQIRRADRIRERSLEAILRETMLIDTAGARVGQVNGLAVLSLGSLSFGRPSRITARYRVGRGEVIDIEREVDLGGPLHSKGVLILSSFLASRYAADRPLSLSASLVFEQSYGGVDGDSASSTELYALLSALADLPINQGMAVTGSVNQYGEVQAIGGANEKIEGFFDICVARGLTGEQGVLIPASNVKHLMLRDDVVRAAKDGKFSIYPIATIDEGIEILTRTPAGERDANGHFADGSVNARVEQRLVELAETRRRFAATNRDEGSTP